ncbi:MAG: lyase family protein [Thermus sp.]|uniref:lyase family protein n=1 Tax=Thermus sp. TaxID=275 RepID=UPI0025ED7DB7|nr:lyase family protein [Thermus sp.]MCS6868991.1 lyase family protein [Thermus sp.]MCS7218966.1 lyase family protein [Thermus sp.]MCX7848951.1 lyase family protein [Thermus sp.]
MRWHGVYRRFVLGRHYRFAREALVPHFFDALTAYALELARLGVPRAGEAVAALRELRTLPLPSFTGEVEDVFFSIQAQLAEHWGEEVAGAVRRGLSRNDLDLTVFRAYLKDRVLAVLGDFWRLRRAVVRQAEAHRGVPILLRTHHQPAQPSTLDHYLLGVEALLGRDYQRLLQALGTLDRSPLGASALAGSPYPVSRERLAALLGFAGPVENTLDAVAAGDYALELAMALAGLGASLSRFLTDLLLWAERGGFVVGESLAQGSSFMPQKRNPVVLEHARIHAAGLLGGIGPLAHLNHNTPFTDLNDHSTGVLEPLAQVLGQAEAALALTRVALEESRFVPELLLEGFTPGVLASEAVDLLVRKGVPLAEAYRRVQGALPGLEPGALGVEAGELALWVSLEGFFARREVLGGVGPKARAEALKRALGRLREERRALNALRARVRLARRFLAQHLQAQEGLEASQEEG